MTKLVLKTAVLIMACLSTLVFAKTQDKAIDPYSQCVDDTIQQLKLGILIMLWWRSVAQEPKLYMQSRLCSYWIK